MACKTKYHRDGTITVYDVYLQKCRRIGADVAYRDDNLMTSLNQKERKRIKKMSDRLSK